MTKLEKIVLAMVKQHCETEYSSGIKKSRRI